MTMQNAGLWMLCMCLGTSARYLPVCDSVSLQCVDWIPASLETFWLLRCAHKPGLWLRLWHSSGCDSVQASAAAGLAGPQADGAAERAAEEAGVCASCGGRQNGSLQGAGCCWPHLYTQTAVMPGRSICRKGDRPRLSTSSRSHTAGCRSLHLAAQTMDRYRSRSLHLLVHSCVAGASSDCPAY